jgi:hypothetical protein
MKRLTGAVVLCLALVFSGSVAWAQEQGAHEAEDTPWEKYSFKFGGFITTLDSQVQIGSKDLGAGIVVDVEDALGLESNLTVFRGDLGWRFGKTRRHQWNFSFSDFRRNASKFLGKKLEIGDTTFRAGTQLETDFNFQIIQAKYTYSLFQDDRFNFGLGLGAYVMPIQFKISAGGRSQVEESFVAPLPVIGARFDFAVTPKFFIRQTLDVLYLEVGDFRGAIVDLGIGAEYKIWQNFGIGADLNVFNIGIEAKGEDYPEIDFVGRFDFGYNALLLYGKVYF